jgi:hypothetical protein
MRTMLKLWLLLVTLGLASQVRAQGPMVAGVAPVFGGDRVPVYEVHRALAGQPGDERSLGVGKWRSERALWSETASGVFAFLRCVSNGPHRMVGPVFYPVRRPKFDIHAQVLLGGARETGVNFESDGTLVRGFVNHPAWAGGIGLQYRISPAVSLRPEVEYLRTSFFNSSVATQGQPNLRASFSMIYTFGRR